MAVWPGCVKVAVNPDKVVPLKVPPSAFPPVTAELPVTPVELSEKTTLNVVLSPVTDALDLIVNCDVKAAKPIDNPTTTNNKTIRTIFLVFLDQSQRNYLFY